MNLPPPQQSQIAQKESIIKELIKMGLDDSLFEQAKKEHGLKLASLDTERWLAKFLTNDPELMELKQTIRVLSTLEDNIMIYGETGTGKELLARALHGNRDKRRASKEQDSNFMAINCAGLPPDLMESELFGHVRGAFTSANADKPGIFKSARDGTVFLDEIGELPLAVQAKLLRVLQEKTIRPVGSNNEIPVSFRCVSATHRDLPSLVMAGKFREDLYHRLTTFEIKTKPVRERIECGDFEILVHHYACFGPKETVPMELIDYILRADGGYIRGNVRSIQKLCRRWLVQTARIGL